MARRRKHERKTLYHLYSHARTRAWEHYGLVLSPERYTQYNTWIQQKHERVIPDWVESHTRLWCWIHDNDQHYLVVYNTRLNGIATFLRPYASERHDLFYGDDYDTADDEFFDG